MKVGRENGLLYYIGFCFTKKVNGIMLTWYMSVYKELEYERKTTLLTNTGSHFVLFYSVRLT